MNRRTFLTATAGVTVMLSGCSTDDDVVVSGSTGEIDDWVEELEGGQLYELELEHNDGDYALGSVERHDNFEDMARIEIEDGGTETEEFEAPETTDYLISVSTNGRASVTLRRI